MMEERLKYLLERYQNNLLTEQEQEEWINAFKDPELRDLLNQVIDETYHGLPDEDLSGLPPITKEEMFQAIIAHQPDEIPEIRRRSIWPRIAAAASILIALGIVGYFYTHKEQPQQVAVTQPLKGDIAPGKNTATLTLANGQKIILSNAFTGQIAKQAGVSISKTANGQVVYTVANDNTLDANEFNTLSTANGETYKVNLPDGTQVWLNAASSLTYPARFSGTDRKVKLSGEGYFEVAKDKMHPFIVSTDKQDVTVLGTHFNINAYTNENATKTTLLEGSVKITADNQQQIIKPSQQAALRNGGIKVQEIDTELATAWKNNKFIFDGDDIQYIMRMVERWYNVEVVYDTYTANEKFYGGVSRYENVSEVLKSLESTGKIHFKIEGRKIFLRK